MSKRNSMKLLKKHNTFLQVLAMSPETFEIFYIRKKLFVGIN